MMRHHPRLFVLRGIRNAIQRGLQGMPAIGTKVCVVPVRMRKIEIDLQPVLAPCITHFSYYISFERRLHNAVSQVTTLEFGPPRRRPINTTLYSPFRVVHGETFVMIASDCEHLHPILFEELHPFIGIESRGVPGFVLLLIFLLLRGRQIQKWPTGIPPLLN